MVERESAIWRDRWGPRLRRLFVLLPLALYLLFFLPLLQQFGATVMPLATVPVLAAGALLGLRQALLTALALFPIHTLLLNMGGRPGWDAAVYGGAGVLIHTVIVMVGIVVGSLRELFVGARSLVERLMLDAQRREIYLRAANRLAVATTRGEVEEILKEEAVAVMGAITATLLVAEEGPYDPQRQSPDGLAFEAAQAAFQNGQPVDQSIGGRAFLATPLQLQGKAIGALSVERQRRFLPEDSNALGLLAGLGAPALFAVGRLETLERWADTDALTGLANRRKGEALLEQFLLMAARPGLPVSISLLDLDRFKVVNDEYGHATGDDVLRRVSAILSDCFREGDVLARWGGEELVVGMFGASKEVGIQRMQDALSRVSSEQFNSPRGPFSVTFSAGVATYPEDGAELAPLLARADASLYRAKSEGRARVV